MIKQKKAAMELSMSTIVILVLAMVMLVLGIILLRNIFGTATNAIDGISTGVQNEINTIFETSDSKLSFYPKGRKLTIDQGVSGKGFAFSINNNLDSQETFTFTVTPDSYYDFSDCGWFEDEAVEKANEYLLVRSGSRTIGRDQFLEQAILIDFKVPNNAPKCSMGFLVNVKYDTDKIYDSADIRVTIK